MGSYMVKRCLCMLSCLLIFQLSLATSLNSNTPVEVSSSKVSLDLYYESLCPYSAKFVVNYLSNIFENGLIDIVDLKLFPWGNAKLKSDSTITCQHGSMECLLNTVEACAIDIWPAVSKHFPFINCVESLALQGKSNEWQSCFKKLGLDEKPVKDCYSSGYGNKLEWKYADLTKALKPPHKYVPWVVVNKQPLYEDYGNFTSYVCKAYKGTPPSACDGVSSDSFLRQMIGRSHPVCYAIKNTVVPMLRDLWFFIGSWMF